MRDENIEWLLRQGGPVIRYRTWVELIGDAASPEARAAEALLLADPRVSQLLDYLRAFDPGRPMTIGHFNAVHSSRSRSLESAAGKLLELGLRRGHNDFDRLMARLREYVTLPAVAEALATPPGRCTVEAGRRIFAANLVASYLLRGGYTEPEVVAFVRRRLQLIRRVAASSTFDVYLSDEEIERLPRKRPDMWQQVPVLRPRHDPTSGDQPLPLIHDLYALAYLPAGSLAPEDQAAISAVVRYALDPRLQSLGWGYGLLWNDLAKAFHGCGWSPHVPRLHTGQPAQDALIVQFAELFSRFRAAQQTTWFKETLRHLGEHRLDDGRYLFPRAYLQERRVGYYVGGYRLGLESNRRARKALMLESTFRFELIAANVARLVGEAPASTGRERTR